MTRTYLYINMDCSLLCTSLIVHSLLVAPLHLHNTNTTYYYTQQLNIRGTSQDSISIST